MLDFGIDRHTWNCQIRTHIHTKIYTRTHNTHTHTHTKSRKGRGENKRNQKKEGGFREERKKREKDKRKRGKKGKKRKKREKGGLGEGKIKREGDGFNRMEERGYCAPRVCVFNFSGGLAVWWLYKQTNRQSHCDS